MCRDNYRLSVNIGSWYDKRSINIIEVEMIGLKTVNGFMSKKYCRRGPFVTCVYQSSNVGFVLIWVSSSSSLLDRQMFSLPVRVFTSPF